MRAAVIACMLGCAAHEAPAPRAPEPIRCTLRISSSGGLFVDGDLMSRHAAVARCKTAEEGATVVLDGASDDAWKKTRDALEHEGVAIHVRGPICYGRDPESCGQLRPGTRPPSFEIREPINAKPHESPVGRSPFEPISKPIKAMPEEPVRKAEPPPPPEKPAPPPPVERSAPRPVDKRAPPPR